MIGQSTHGSWRSVFSWCLILLVFGSVTACGPKQAGETAGLPALEELNVVLIVIDTLGAKHLGCLQPGLTTSPNIDRLARSGVLFRKAYTTSPWTEPAVASLFTSLMPSDSKMLFMFDYLDAEHETLAELMRARGKRTASVVSHFLVGGRYGFDQGFERCSEEPVGDYTAISSQKVTDLALKRLDWLKDENFFLFVHYFDPHFFYNHHPQFDRTTGYSGQLETGMARGQLREMRFDLDQTDLDFLVGLYREEIAFVDEQIGRLLRRLEVLGLSENTLVILTADHGEAFMEHGWIGHTRNLYDELLHVPLILSLPGSLEPVTVDAKVSLLDVVPTLLALSCDPVAEPDWQGRSLLGYLADSGGSGSDATSASADTDRGLFAEVSFMQPADWPAVSEEEKTAFFTALRAGELKLIHDIKLDRYELYDLSQDPGEGHDLAPAGHPALTELQQQLLAWEAERVKTWDSSLETMQEADPAVIERIRSLGYLR
ncbi:MAG: sulfatase [bacterium]